MCMKVFHRNESSVDMNINQSRLRYHMENIYNWIKSLVTSSMSLSLSPHLIYFLSLDRLRAANDCDSMALQHCAHENIDSSMLAAGYMIIFTRWNENAVCFILRGKLSLRAMLRPIWKVHIHLIMWNIWKSLRKISVRMIHMAVSYVEVEEGSNDGENVFNARTTTRVESFVDWHLMWKSVQGRFLLCLIWMRKMLKKMNDDSFGAVNSQISRVPKCARCEWESRATSWNQIDLAICVWKPHNNFVFYHFTQAAIMG